MPTHKKIHRRNEELMYVGVVDAHAWSHCGRLMHCDRLSDDWDETTCGSCMNSKPKDGVEQLPQIPYHVSNVRWRDE